MKVEEELYERIWENLLNEEPIIEKGSRVDIALKLLENGHKLLDIGCGDGTLGYFAKNKYQEIFGIDLSENALKIAEIRGVITKKVNLNDDNIAFEDNHFDAVTCLDVLEHVFEPRYLIKEMHRVLKIEGVLVISTPNIRYWRHLFNLIIKGRFPKTSDDESAYDGGHLHYFTFNDIENLLEKQGFIIIGRYGVFGRGFLKEFLSAGVVIKATKRLE